MSTIVEGADTAAGPHFSEVLASERRAHRAVHQGVPMADGATGVVGRFAGCSLPRGELRRYPICDHLGRRHAGGLLRFADWARFFRFRPGALTDVSKR